MTVSTDLESACTLQACTPVTFPLSPLNYAEPIHGMNGYNKNGFVQCAHSTNA